MYFIYPHVLMGGVRSFRGINNLNLKFTIINKSAIFCIFKISQLNNKAWQTI